MLYGVVRYRILTLDYSIRTKERLYLSTTLTIFPWSSALHALDAELWCSDSMYPLSPRSSFFGPPCSCFSMDLYQLDPFFFFSFILFLIYFNVDFGATFLVEIMYGALHYLGNRISIFCPHSPTLHIILAILFFILPCQRKISLLSLVSASPDTFTPSSLPFIPFAGVSRPFGTTNSSDIQFWLSRV